MPEEQPASPRTGEPVERTELLRPFRATSSEAVITYDQLVRVSPRLSEFPDGLWFRLNIPHPVLSATLEFGDGFGEEPDEYVVLSIDARAARLPRRSEVDYVRRLFDYLRTEHAAQWRHVDYRGHPLQLCLYAECDEELLSSYRKLQRALSEAHKTAEAETPETTETRIRLLRHLWAGPQDITSSVDEVRAAQLTVGDLPPIHQEWYGPDLRLEMESPIPGTRWRATVGESLPQERSDIWWDLFVKADSWSVALDMEIYLDRLTAELRCEGFSLECYADPDPNSILISWNSPLEEGFIADLLDATTRRLARAHQRSITMK